MNIYSRTYLGSHRLDDHITIMQKLMDFELQVEVAEDDSEDEQRGTCYDIYYICECWEVP